MRIRMMQSNRKQPIWADLVQRRVRVKKKRLIWCIVMFERESSRGVRKSTFSCLEFKVKICAAKKKKKSSLSLSIIRKVKLFTVSIHWQSSVSSVTRNRNVTFYWFLNLNQKNHFQLCHTNRLQLWILHNVILSLNTSTPSRCTDEAHDGVNSLRGHKRLLI